MNYEKKINFSEKINVNGINIPLWTIGFTPIDQKTKTLVIDCYVEDSPSIVFAINKFDQSVYLYAGAITGDIDDSGDLGARYRSSYSIAKELVGDIIETGVVSATPDDKVFIPLKECVREGIYQKETISNVLRNLSENGGIDMFSNIDNGNNSLFILSKYEAYSPQQENMIEPLRENKHDKSVINTKQTPEIPF